MFFIAIIVIMILLMLLSSVFILSLHNWMFDDIVKTKVFFLCMIIAGITVLSSIVGYVVGNAKMYYNEIWHYTASSVRYEMQWTTKETKTYRVKVGERKVKQSDGTYRKEDVYETREKHYTELHGPYYYMVDEYGDNHSIDSSDYQKWKGVWKNEVQTGIHNGSSANFDRSIDGPIMTCKWPGSFDTIYPVSEIHMYKNKVRASNSSVMKLAKPTPELQDKYPRPADKGNTSPIFINGANVPFNADDRLLLDRVNAHLGKSFEIHCMFQLFNAKEHDMNIATEMITAWEGTNKNELVIFIGIDPDSGRVSWIKTESWMDNTELYGYLSDDLLGKVLSAKICADTLMNNVPKYWKRKHFSDFDYLRIEMPAWTILVVASIQIIGTIIASIKINSCVNYKRY